MDYDSLNKKLLDAAEKLALIQPRNAEEQAIYGFLVGASYGLRETINFGYIDGTGDKLPSDYSEQLQKLASALAASGDLDNDKWLAGFYFNTALQRLSPACERLGKYIGKRQDLIPNTRKEVNKLKHEVSGVLSGRKVTIDEALNSLTLLVVAAEVILKSEQS
ncbi:hypothetical protein [Aliikangiella coralliicola]|uniref:Uncharacterized protein n=1 Tax=Aliikangiella coralliicola TaxID=2592383 RepID=A0A545TSQ7_9GAMM|nr:hypothetical protein [Aliikangiella coralliicola]TQV80249.1 hypothetical protein FLL46_26385 [Aliikangiella coralliicola]